MPMSMSYNESITGSWVIVGVNGFWFHRFLVSMVSWFHRFRGVKGFMVSWCQWFHGFIGFVVSMVS